MRCWKELMLAGLLLFAIPGVAQTAVTTSGGTTNTVPLYTGSSTLGDSVITQSGGNIGIGTTDPGNPFTTKTTATTGNLGIIGVDTGLTPSGQGIDFLKSAANFSGPMASIRARAVNYGNSSASDLEFATNGDFDVVPSVRMTLDSKGNLGIGTTTPQYRLDVAGTIGANGISVIQSGSIPLAADGTYQIAASGALNGVYTIDWYGPNRAEHYAIAVVAHQYAAAAITILNSSTYTNPPVLSDFRVVGNGSGDTRYFVVDAANRNGGAGSMYVTAVGSAAYLSLSSTPGGSTAIPNSLVSLNSAQSTNVGIGTASPGAKLEVDGNIKLTPSSGASITFADGTVQSTAYTGVSCGGDYAESVDVTGDRHLYGPGDLLVLDPDHPGDVLKSAKAYSTSIAGIYSTKPGYVGRRQTGPKSPREVPMAMVGIVPAHVKTENGPIHVGDLLVSSSTSGYAMKGTDRSRMLGAVVGKAAGSLESGKGIIEVLVTLQ